MKNNLKKIRLYYNLRQADVAELIGLKAEDRISHWEKGTAMPSVVNLFKLCEVFKITPYELYPGPYNTLPDPPLKNTAG